MIDLSDSDDDNTMLTISKDAFAPKTTQTFPGKPKYSRATQANPAINAKPIVELDAPRTVPTGGRPRKLARMPRLPGLTPAEQELFDDFINEYLETFPDLLPTDYRMLFLAAPEYIKTLRLMAAELESGTIVAMSRQHPAVNMRALLDQLSVTRRARARTPDKGSDSDQRALDLFMGLSGKQDGKGK